MLRLSVADRQLYKMKLDLYQIDAFTEKIFGGNPACVVPLTDWLPDDILLKISQENAVAETAFFIDKGDKIHLRWFTPEIEMDLCGHATLAAAHCLKTILNYPDEKLIFETMSGDLSVSVKDDVYSLHFPSRMPNPSELPEIIKKSINIQPQEVHKSRDYVLIFNTAEEIEKIKIDRPQFDQINLTPGGVIVTAIGNDCDFVSRFFTPQASILEDAVTGSAHCSLIPLWASKLKRDELYAKQISKRGGILHCQNKKDSVIIRLKLFKKWHINRCKKSVGVLLAWAMFAKLKAEYHS